MRLVESYKFALVVYRRGLEGSVLPRKIKKNLYEYITLLDSDNIKGFVAVLVSEASLLHMVIRKSSNHFDDLFSTLEEWEVIIKSLEEALAKQEPSAPEILMLY